MPDHHRGREEPTPESVLVDAARLFSVDQIEWLAGKLLVVSAKLRKDRMGPGDAHEMRHLLRAVEGGNSDECGPLGEHCVLDFVALHDYLDSIERAQ